MSDPMPNADLSKLRRAYVAARERLLAEQTPGGFWVGELSPSALSTATASIALLLVDPDRYDRLIRSGLEWLASHRNSDGGWGDTPRSLSNISTTLLVDAAFRLAGKGGAPGRGQAYLAAHAGDSMAEVAASLRSIYGSDRTFAVPILVTCALAMEGDAGHPVWRHVPRLPFELACCPASWYRWLRLHVVSYALPALVAMGHLIHCRRPTANLAWRALRWAAKGRAMGRLAAIQPESGGFLEATPLTSFVTMSLAAAGLGHHQVARQGAAFLEASARPDGSWPIDTNLATWVTTLSVEALTAGDGSAPAGADRTREWLLGCQHKRVHPYTNSAPGGWAWTDLSGGVPDADDTSGALVALGRLGGRDVAAAREGVRWLLDLQNRDGGWPTFCRGWGKLPFDRSAPDLTGHALRALAAWPEALPDGQAIQRGRSYLAAAQSGDGSWLPLWFGNERAPGQANPVYGTARVLAAYDELGWAEAEEAGRGVDYLVAAQNADAGWGGSPNTPTSVEETGLAVSALSGWMGRPAARQACLAGAKGLADRVLAGGMDAAAPIGLYFAKLWYYEALYPIIVPVAALGKALSRLGVDPSLRHEGGRRGVPESL